MGSIAVRSKNVTPVGSLRGSTWKAGIHHKAVTMAELDAVIIGAGHNGLTCAAYLAMAGLKVKLVERRKTVGGAAVTEEFHPGFRNSVAAYTVSLLNPQVIADLKLARARPAHRRAARAEFPARAGRQLPADRRRPHAAIDRAAERERRRRL